jgi:uncharacterized damage-inducible protein DinB
MTFSRELLLDLFSHMEAADAAVWSAVLTHDAAREDVEMKKYLLHTSTVQRAFLDAWTAQPFTFRTTFDEASLPAELDDVRAYYPRARAYLTSVDEASLAAPFAPPWLQYVEQHMGRTPGTTTLGETALQVISHTTHHRAQASARLRALGGTPPLVDYIAWLWRDRPAPEWPAASVTA